MKKVLLMLTLFACVISGGCGGSSNNSFVQNSPEQNSQEQNQQEQNSQEQNSPEQNLSENEKMIQAMSLEEKVGQLFIMRPEHLCTLVSTDYIHYHRVSWDYSINDNMIETLHKYPVGGFAFFSRNIDTQEQVKKFISDLDAECTIKPFIAVDEEGGSVRRIGRKFSADVAQIGPMKEIGDTGDPQNAYDAAYAIGGYVKELGFNLDFAPVADINTNPDNIVIGNRAFGDDPYLVSEMVSAFLDGLHAQEVMGTIKHFPGHGDTTNDTHTGYVAIYKTWDELMQAELIPFIDNFDKTDMVMAEHITLENITSDGLPASLSHQLLTDRLRNELGYDGVVVTDSMEMGAINNTYPSGEASVMAIEAGNDIILCPYNYIESFNAIVSAVKSGRLTEARINESVRRILALKFKEE